jgi:hypothetical protein
MINIDQDILYLNNKLLSNDRFEKIHDEIYICKKFLSEEECYILVEDAKKDIGAQGKQYTSNLLINYKDRLLSLIDFESQGNIKESNINGGWDKLVLRSDGDSDKFHIDIYNYLNKYMESSQIQFDERLEKINTSFMSFVIYFSEDFDGGSISYPEYNFKYKPSIGDMILHNVQIVHGVEPVTSGERWSYQGSIDMVKYIEKDLFTKFIVDNEYFQNRHDALKMPKEPDHKMKDDMFFYREDQSPLLNKRLLKYVTQEPYL